MPPSDTNSTPSPKKKVKLSKNPDLILTGQFDTDATKIYDSKH